MFYLFFLVRQVRSFPLYHLFFLAFLVFFHMILVHLTGEDLCVSAFFSFSVCSCPPVQFFPVMVFQCVISRDE